MTSLPMEDKDPHDERARRREVRSFVLRGGRLTAGQKRALEELQPRYGVKATDGQLDFEALFGNDHSVIMEIGFGDGNATWQMAAAYPQENYLGVEVHQPGVGQLLMKLDQAGIENVRIACGDAVELLREQIPTRSLAGVRVFFPDPWPKKRHHKRRLIQAPFIEMLAIKMKEEAILHMATDWKPYALHMLEVMRSSRNFENLSAAGDFCPQPEWRPRTKYEKRGERLGHRVFDLVFRRCQGL
jgi:tRNA (guanine-N7-)-methyltransferase